MRRIIQFLTAIIGLLVGFAFHARNHALITLDFYSGTFSLPLSVIVVASLLLGTLLGAAVLMPGRWRQARRLRRLERAVRAPLVAPVAHPPPVAANHVD